MFKTKFFTFIVLSVLVLGIIITFQAAQANVVSAERSSSSRGIRPLQVPDNASCTVLGYKLGYKIEKLANGTFMFPRDPFNSVTISLRHPYFDWKSTQGIDAVIVKGGTGANLYAYPQEFTWDESLHAPIDSRTLKPYGLSHIEFCYDYELVVTKNAITSFTRTWQWSIAKTVSPAVLDLFAAASGISQYTVSVDKTGYTDGDWAVNGEITIFNPTPLEATIDDVVDVVSPDIPAYVDCGVGFPYTLPPSQTLICTYSTPLPDGSTRVNTATVYTSGPVGGGVGTADVIFGNPTTEIYNEINVTDSNGQSWGPVSDDASWVYDMNFTCSSNPGDYTNGIYTYPHDNIATITETGQSDGAQVTVNCYGPVVSKDSHTDFTRFYVWGIDKSADQTDLTLATGEQFWVNYWVSVDVTSYSDWGWSVSGNIYVYNPHPGQPMTVLLSDTILPDFSATLDCGGVLTILPGETGICGYFAPLPDGQNRVNYVVATLNGVSFDSFSDVIFDQPTTMVDGCIDIIDDQYGSLGTTCGNEPLPKVIPYGLYIGPYEECNTFQFINTASFVTPDTGATGSDTWVINVTVQCIGCTLTQGYWKTHSIYGPAPYDPTWALIGEDTIFYLSQQSFYTVLWTPPQGGNAYYILAHQFIAAELNALNGALVPPEVQTAIDTAATLFSTYTPDEVVEMKGKPGRELRDQFIALAELLDAYNNGLIGPGHCNE